jgi:hypothetical protein
MQQRRPDEKVEMPVYSDLLKDMEQQQQQQQQQQQAPYTPSPPEYNLQEETEVIGSQGGGGRRVRFADSVEYYDDDDSPRPHHHHHRRGGGGYRRSSSVADHLDNAPYEPLPTPVTPPISTLQPASPSSSPPSVWTTLKSLPKDKDVAIGAVLVFAIFSYALPKVSARWPSRLLDPLTGHGTLLGMAGAALIATILLRVVWSSR